MFSKKSQDKLIIDRRDVLMTLGAGAAISLCPSILKASAALDFEWERGIDASAPQGQAQTVSLEGVTSVDVANLQPGDVLVVQRDAAGNAAYENLNFKQNIAILYRTDEQIALAANDESKSPQADADRVTDPRYLVVDLLCPHRDWAVGISPHGELPFNCMKHNSKFDTSGRAFDGRADNNLKIPDYTISGTVITFT